MKRSEPYGKVFILFLSAVTIAFFMILLPFYGAVFWGFILAVIKDRTSTMDKNYCICVLPNVRP